MIQQIVASLMTGPQGDIFSDLHTAEYDAIMDKILITRHGLAPVDPDMATEEDSTYADMAIYAYLTERAIYIRQNLAYEEAEYNPIENYSQIEHETTDVTYGERDETDTHTDDAHEYSIEHDYQLHTQETHTPEIITESYTEADVVSEQTQLTSTTLNQAVPFESSDLFDMDKTSETPGKITYVFVDFGVVSDLCLFSYVCEISDIHFAAYLRTPSDSAAASAVSLVRALLCSHVFQK